MSSSQEQQAMSGVHPTGDSTAGSVARESQQQNVSTASTISPQVGGTSDYNKAAQISQSFIDERESGAAKTSTTSSTATAETGHGENKGENASAPVGSASHVQNITSGLAGMVLTAPLVAVEKVSPSAAARLSHAGEAIGQYVQSIAHAKGGEGPTYYEKATGMVQAHLPQSLGGHAQPITSSTSSSSTNPSGNAYQTAQNAADTVKDYSSSAADSAKQSLPNTNTQTGYNSGTLTNPTQPQTLTEKVTATANEAFQATKQTAAAYVPQTLGGQAVYQPATGAQGAQTDLSENLSSNLPSASTAGDSSFAARSATSTEAPKHNSNISEPLTGQTQHMTGLKDETTSEDYQQANQKVQSLTSNLLGAMATAPLAAVSALAPHAQAAAQTVQQKVTSAAQNVTSGTTSSNPNQGGYLESAKSYLPSGLGGQDNRSEGQRALDSGNQTSTVGDSVGQTAQIAKEHAASVLPNSLVSGNPTHDSAGNKTVGQKSSEIYDSASNTAGQTYNSAAQTGQNVYNATANTAQRAYGTTADSANRAAESTKRSTETSSGATQPSSTGTATQIYDSTTGTQPHKSLNPYGSTTDTSATSYGGSDRTKSSDLHGEAERLYENAAKSIQGGGKEKSLLSSSNEGVQAQLAPGHRSEGPTGYSMTEDKLTHPVERLSTETSGNQAQRETSSFSSGNRDAEALMAPGHRQQGAAGYELTQQELQHPVDRLPSSQPRQTRSADLSQSTESGHLQDSMAQYTVPGSTSHVTPHSQSNYQSGSGAPDALHPQGGTPKLNYAEPIAPVKTSRSDQTKSSADFYKTGSTSGPTASTTSQTSHSTPIADTHSKTQQIARDTPPSSTHSSPAHSSSHHHKTASQSSSGKPSLGERVKHILHRD